MAKTLKDRIREADFSIFNSNFSYSFGQQLLIVKDGMRKKAFSDVTKYQYAELLKARIS